MRGSASGQMTRQRPQVALRRQPCGLDAGFAVCDRPARRAGLCARGIAHHVVAFLGLERAGAIDERAAGLERIRTRRRAGGAAAPRAPRYRFSRLSQGMSGWRRIVPVDEQGASTRTASNGPPRHSVASAATISAVRPSRCEVLLHPFEPLGSAVDRGDLRAGGGELRGLAAGRRAEIGDARPLTSPSSRAGNAAAASCTHQAPSA